MPGAVYSPPKGDIARRFNARVVASLVMAIVTLIITAIAGSLAWWSLSMTANQFGFSVNADFHLSSVCVSGFGGIPMSLCAPYTGGPFGGGMPAAIGGTFGVANALMIVGLVMSLLLLLFSILGALWPRAGIVGMAASFAGAAVTLAAPLFLFFALPGSVGGLFGTGTPTVQGFFGAMTDPLSGTTARWGGSVGWFLSFGAFALFLVSAFVQVLAWKSVAPMGNYRPAQAQVYVPVPYGAPMQPAYPGYSSQPPNPAYSGYAPPQPHYAQPTQNPSAPPLTQAPSDSPLTPNRFCTSCGSPLSAGATACARCGAPVS